MFVYKPTLDTLQLKKDKATDHVLKSLYTALQHSIKLSAYKIVIKFDKDPLAIEQDIYTTKIVSIYIAYDLDTWARNPNNNIKLKFLLLGTSNTVKIVIKNSGYIVAME